MPHADTLNRLLGRIEPAEIERAHVALVTRLIRNKKFSNYLIENCYPIALDGTQKNRLDYLWDDEPLERTVGKGDSKHKQYYVYVLEASLCFKNGMVIPLMTEFLEYSQGDSDRNKQDCELKACYRLCQRIKAQFPRLKIMLLLDGLYACGPVMALCQQYRWEYMIVLKDKDLSSVWNEVNSLSPLQSNNKLQQTHKERQQSFEWVNDIEYIYGDVQSLALHVIVCEETWKSINNEAETVTEKSRHVWISSIKLAHKNIHTLCNLGARKRWGIESNINVEKHQGYYSEHRFSYDWNAMKCYHYLMRLAHLLNTLCRYSHKLNKLYIEMGVRGFLDFIKSTISAPWLPSSDIIRIELNKKIQLRLI